MNVLFSAQDPGGRNAIAPVIEALRTQGAEVSENIASPDVFVFGTSAAGDSADKRIMGTIGNVPSVAVLDFWGNYWQRFSTPGKKDFAYLPTRICVMDDVAKEEMAAEGFPADRLVVTGNPHFDHFADGITSDEEEDTRILFISQPLRAVGALPGYTPSAYDEYAVLRDLIKILARLPERFFLSLRLHPKEPTDKFTEYLGPRVRRAPEATLEEALSHAGLIMGMCSPVLMQAAAAGKKVLSYEPDLAGEDPLVSNRVGVTVRIENEEALADALVKYVRGEWSFATRSLREVWPTGATERVVSIVRELAANHVPV